MRGFVAPGDQLVLETAKTEIRKGGVHRAIHAQNRTNAKQPSYAPGKWVLKLGVATNVFQLKVAFRRPAEVGFRKLKANSMARPSYSGSRVRSIKQSNLRLEQVRHPNAMPLPNSREHHR